MIANSLFVLQLACVLIFGIMQSIKMLTTTEGVSVMWIISSEAFFALNLWLVCIASRRKTTRVTAQTKFIYVVWLVLGVMEFCAMYFFGGLTWNKYDTIALTFITGGTVATLAYAYHQGLLLSSPLIKASIAILAIGVPQFLMALNIYSNGGSGLDAWTVGVGHISVITRMGQLLVGYSVTRTAERLGSIASETANWASWIVVTVIWAYR